jgi:hypothetical protein
MRIIISNSCQNQKWQVWSHWWILFAMPAGPFCILLGPRSIHVLAFHWVSKSMEQKHRCLQWEFGILNEVGPSLKISTSKLPSPNKKDCYVPLNNSLIFVLTWRIILNKSRWHNLSHHILQFTSDKMSKSHHLSLMTFF